jgi:hypothetical protein
VLVSTVETVFISAIKVLPLVAEDNSGCVLSGCIVHGLSLKVYTYSAGQNVQKPLHYIIALMMEAACTSEPSVNFYQTTRRNNPEDNYLHTRGRENLKSHNTTQLTSLQTTWPRAYLAVCD